MKQGSLKIRSGNITTNYRRAITRGAKAGVVYGIMNRRAVVFSREPKLKKLIANRLGWVDSASLMKKRIGSIENFGKSVFSAGIKHVVLMGMGGSSLCPELFKLVHKKHPRLKSFDVIDSTDPSAVSAVARKIDLKKTLFIVASKSGGTVETRSHEAYFIGLIKDAGIRNIGSHFVAITDKGSSLEKSARSMKYRKIFINPSDIGGRYSALSFFGLVPGFFAGVDLKALIDDALVMQKLLTEREGELNPALTIGTLMYVAAKNGRDKLTFVTTKRVAPLVPWIEQLIAESTGKKKKGVIPIENETPVDITKYGKDRMFVFLSMASERTTAHDKLKLNLNKKKIPVIDIVLGSKAELGRQFLLWEAATAVTGWYLGINPFDEPNVTESKNNTKAILDALERSGVSLDQPPQSRWGKLSLIGFDSANKFGKIQTDNKVKFLKRFFKGTKPPHYVAVLNYFKSDHQSEQALENIRNTVRDKTKTATIRGYGPRFLHSIGQLYKGGPQVGMYIVFMRSKYKNLTIPGQSFDFGQLISAQAAGDSQALMKRKLPTMVIAIDGNPADGLKAFNRSLKRALK